jgi:hypothetical protein
LRHAVLKKGLLTLIKEAKTLANLATLVAIAETYNVPVVGLRRVRARVAPFCETLRKRTWADMATDIVNLIENPS